MRLTNTRDTYGLVAILFHWLVAMLIIGLLAVGLTMVRLPSSPGKSTLYHLHKASGVLAFGLVCARFSWRLLNVTPDYPLAMPLWQKILAHSVHFIIYLFLFAMPISGYLLSCAAGMPPSFYGLCQLPAVITPHPAWVGTLAAAHKWLAYLLLGLIGGHIAAALEHHFIERDNILRRMLGLTRRWREQENPASK